MTVSPENEVSCSWFYTFLNRCIGSQLPELVAHAVLLNNNIVVIALLSKYYHVQPQIIECLKFEYRYLWLCIIIYFSALYSHVAVLGKTMLVNRGQMIYCSQSYEIWTLIAYIFSEVARLKELKCSFHHSEYYMTRSIWIHTDIIVMVRCFSNTWAMVLNVRPKLLPFFPLQDLRDC